MNTTEEVRLRAMEPEDLDALYAIENDQQLWDLGVTNVPYSRYLLHDYIANTRNDIYADGQVRLIIEAEGRGVVGVVDLMNFDPKNNKAELGIAIMKPFRRHGYARAAVQQILRYASEVVHLHQVYIIVATTNDAIINLFRQLGFSEPLRLNEWLFDGKKYNDAFLMQTFL